MPIADAIDDTTTQSDISDVPFAIPMLAPEGGIVPSHKTTSRRTTVDIGAGRLGLRLHTTAHRRVEVAVCVDKCAAHAAGIRVGDTICAVGGVDCADQAADRVFELIIAADRPLSVTILQQRGISFVGCGGWANQSE